MLGAVGKAARRALISAGYQIYRPTRHEKAELRSFWEDWLGRDPHRFAEIYSRNRQLLARVGEWVDEPSLATSLWRYGVPEQWNGSGQGLNRTGLNDVEQEPTYTDLIAVMLGELGDQFRYLEIGVSVGKNFRQIVELFPDAEIYGLDVEKPNPVLERHFARKSVTFTGPTSTVETLSGKPGQVTLTHHRLEREPGRPVTYFQGDQFAEHTWHSLKGKQFDFIFSDGVHSPHALRDELEHLLANDLIAPGRFMMYWDDLVNIDMQDAFVANCNRLAERFPNSRRGLHWIHGTYGEKRLNGWFAGSPVGA